MILPGTKSTLEDLRWLRQSGLEAQIKKLAAGGTPVLGVCGGYQMLGETLSDPLGAEGGGELRGLGLLPVSTVFSREKARTRVKGEVLAGPFAGARVEGYEIHMGRTETGKAPAFCRLEDGREEAVQGLVFGTYLHGLFDTGELTSRLAGWLLERRGLTPEEARPLSHREHQELEFDRLARALEESLNMPALYRAMGL